MSVGIFFLQPGSIFLLFAYIQTLVGLASQANPVLGLLGNVGGIDGNDGLAFLENFLSNQPLNNTQGWKQVLNQTNTIAQMIVDYLGVC